MKRFAWLIVLIAAACALCAAPGQHRKAKPKAKHKTTSPLVLVSGPAKALVGAWLLNGKDKNTRFVLIKDGTFRSIGSGYSTKGLWSLYPDGLRLIWTESDGKKIKVGTISSMIPLDSPTSFHINQYKYQLVK